MSEAKRQENLLAEQFRSSKPFTAWFLEQTKFASEIDAKPVLVRSDWPWYTAADGTQSETDVLAVFESTSTGMRFALHIENKTAKDRFGPRQVALYPQRARDWLGKDKWGDYVDFECVLVAPQSFADKHADDVKKFDRFVSHEALAKQIPDFVNNRKARTVRLVEIAGKREAVGFRGEVMGQV